MRLHLNHVLETNLFSSEMFCPEELMILSKQNFATTVLLGKMSVKFQKRFLAVNFDRLFCYPTESESPCGHPTSYPGFDADVMRL